MHGGVFIIVDMLLASSGHGSRSFSVKIAVSISSVRKGRKLLEIPEPCILGSRGKRPRDLLWIPPQLE